MPRPLPFLRSLALCALIACGVLATPSLPETNPYHAAVSRLQTHSNHERNTFYSWLHPHEESPAPALTDAQQQLVRECAAAVLAAAHPPLSAPDWFPVLATPSDRNDPTTGPAELYLPTEEIRLLASLAVRSADALPANQALDTYVAVARLGRQQRIAPTMAGQNCGSGIEKDVLASVLRRLDTFSDADLERLAAAWSDLPPAPDLGPTLRTYLDRYLIPIIQTQILGDLRRLEREALAGSPAAAAFADLRLSALVDLGDGERRISLENRATGATFTLREGATVEGVELVSVDFAARHALIRRADREAFIQLQSLQIEERRLGLRQVEAFLATHPELTGMTDRDRRWLTRALTHPGGVDGYAADVFASYEADIAEFLAQTDMPEPTPPPPDAFTADYPLPAALTPSLAQNARRLRENDAQVPLLQAAIRARLATLGHDTAVPPPVAP